jgi:hypothetical protein
MLKAEMQFCVVDVLTPHFAGSCMYFAATKQNRLDLIISSSKIGLIIY